jgi:ribosomal protein S12 methylthiotransferase accessory factor
VLPLQERFGITRLARLTGLDNLGIPVYAAIRPEAKSLVISLGKGATDSAAKASALRESMEIWHAENIALPVRTGTAEQLRAAGRRPVPVGRLPRVREEAVDPDTVLTWVEGRELHSGRSRWVPLDVVSLDFAVDGPAATGNGLLRSSNGLASGNRQDEALVHAICEVIERDAEALWRQSADYARVDPSTVTDGTCRRLIEDLEAAGVQVWIWDITSEFGVPVFGCLLFPDLDHADLRAVGIHDGFGCHRYPEIALSRALTEAAQNRLTYISGSRDDLSHDELSRANSHTRAEEIAHELARIPATRDFRVHLTPRSTPEEDLAELLERLAEHGFDEVVAVDLTSPELGLPVVKVVVPGLEGRFGDCVPGPRALACAGGNN